MTTMNKDIFLEKGQYYEEKESAGGISVVCRGVDKVSEAMARHSLDISPRAPLFFNEISASSSDEQIAGILSEMVITVDPILISIAEETRLSLGLLEDYDKKATTITLAVAKAKAAIGEAVPEAAKKRLKEFADTLFYGVGGVISKVSGKKGMAVAGALTLAVTAACNRVEPSIDTTEPRVEQIESQNVPTITPESATSTPEPTPTPELVSFTYEQALKMTDEEILAAASRFKKDFDFKGEFHFKTEGVTNLTPVEVLRSGENKELPYILYKDQNEEIKMLYNIKEGVWEHAELSEYTDPETGFKVRAFLVTDNTEKYSVEKNWNKWYGLNEIQEGVLAKAVFEYVLPLNNAWENHEEDFLKKLNATGTPKSWYSLGISKMSRTQIRSFANWIRNLWKIDIPSISEENPIEVPLGRKGDVTLTGKEATVVFRISYSNQYATRSYSYDVFGDMGDYRVISGTDISEVLVTVNRSSPALPVYPGGLLINNLRSLTATGFTLSGISKDGEYRAYASTTDDLVIDLCGEDYVNRVWDKAPDVFRQKGIVPGMFDGQRFSLCVIEENRE